MSKYLKKEEAKGKKPITKRWWFWVIVVYAAVMVMGFIGIALGLDEKAQEPAPTATVSSTIPTTAATTEATEADPATTSAIPFDVSFYSEFNNDTTGRWRKSLVATSEAIDKYAVDYYKEYFKADDEVHVIYNFTLNTVNCLTVQAGTLFVSVTEYVKGEEHDAAKACGGQYYGQYQFDLSTGEMTYSSFDQ